MGKRARIDALKAEAAIRRRQQRERKRERQVEISCGKHGLIFQENSFVVDSYTDDTPLVWGVQVDAGWELKSVLKKTDIDSQGDRYFKPATTSSLMDAVQSGCPYK